MSWKVTIKDAIVECTMKSNKKVYIKTKNNKVGKSVMQLITQHMSELGSDVDNEELKKVKEGLSYKDFTLKFKKKDGAEAFYNNIQAILRDPSIPAPPPETVPEGDTAAPGDMAGTVGTTAVSSLPSSGTSSGTSSGGNTLMIAAIAGAVLLVIAGVVIWKRRRG